MIQAQVLEEKNSEMYAESSLFVSYAKGLVFLEFFSKVNEISTGFLL